MKSMNRIVYFVMLSLALACQADDSAEQSDAATSPRLRTAGAGVVAIRNVTVVDGTGERRINTAVVIRDGRIAELVTEPADASIPDEAEIVDGRGKFLMPGLWDAHAHLTYPGECALPLMIAHGVTSVRDLGGTMEIRAWRARVESGEIAGPRIWMAGLNVEEKAWMDGGRAYMAQLLENTDLASFDPFVMSPRLEVDSEAGARAALDSLVALGVDVAKFRNLDGDHFRAFAAAARERGLPLAGHAPGDISLAEAAEAGLASIEHADALTVLGEGTPDEIQNQLSRIRAAGAMFTPTLASGTARSEEYVTAVMADSLGMIEPRQAFVSRGQHEMWRFMFATRGAGGPPDPNARRNEIALVRAAHEAGIPLLVGTDLGVLLTYPGSSVHEELEFLVREVGLTPAQAITAATTNPARWMDVDDELGRIEAGYISDMILLDADPLTDIGNVRSIRAVIWGGRIYTREDLDDLRAVAREAARSGSYECRVPASGGAGIQSGGPIVDASGPNS